jgi:multicomponent Na+:H+ antiporter subunit B
MGPMLLRTTAPLLVALLAVLSVYVALRGHYAPGGGFAGGLILASAIAIQLLAHGVAPARRTLRVHPRTLVAVGLATAAVAACLGPLGGLPLLAPLPGPYVPGVASFGSVMLFDVGVYLIVAGTGATIMFALVEEH